MRQTTNAGGAIAVMPTYPVCYSKVVSSVVITPIRNDADWKYDFWYCYAVFRADVNCFHIQLHGLNNSQYIDGFSWFAIGY